MATDKRKYAPQSFPRSALCIALLIAMPHVAYAARLDYELGAAVMHSDNIVLSENDEISETVFSPRLRFDFEHSSSTLQSTFRGDVQYLDYLDDVYQDDTRGEFVGALDWTISPDRVSFMARDSLSRQSVSTLAAFTPGNQQQINIFEAGPSFFARFGQATLGQIDLRYTNSYAEETETFNNDRYNIAARLRRQTSSTSQVSLNLEATQTEYDTISEFYDYKRYDAYVNYSSQLASLDLSVDAGYSRLQPKGGDDTSGTLFRGRADWRVSPRSTFNANLNYQFADATQDLILRVGDPGDPGSPIIGDPDNPNLQIVPDTFKQKRFNLGYEFTGVRLNLQVQPYYEQLRYLRDDAFDQDNYGGLFSARYEVRPQMFATALAARQHRQFKGIDREDRDTTLALGLATRMSRHWGAQLDYQYRKRDSSVGGQNYVENVVVLSFTYFR
ncbi:outer membrane beta-barrel protein [Pseudoxanthomonas wuyuanensis]